MRVKELTKFIKEREAIRLKKEAGRPRPWTKDPILGKYRFCNVHREDDRVSRWLRNTFYPYYKGNPDIWFVAIVARLLNNPESLWDVREWLLPFNAKMFSRILDTRVTRKQKNFNAAYIVSTNGLAIDKIEYVTYNILNVIWGERENMRPSKKDTLEVYHSMLMQFDGLGSFIAAQVVADLKYMPPLSRALDWWTFAASGPGSRRGLNRVTERDVDAPWREVVWRTQLTELLNTPLIKALDLHAQDLQNCLCEFDKYERARLGQGTPKQIYKEQDQ